MKQLLSAFALVLVLAGGMWYISNNTAGNSETFGQYAYACDGGVEFTMTPAADMSSIELFPGAGAMFAKMTLTPDEAPGARYLAEGVEFVGIGEEVQLTVGNNKLMVCNPKPSTDMAPFNWGDMDEGEGTQIDAAAVVSDSIVGKWRSTEDGMFVREFKDDGTVTDWYDGVSQSTGTWIAFASTSPTVPTVSYPIVENTVYLQLTMKGTQAETLNFQLSKLSPEELNMTYMDRGGVLSFTAVK